MTPSWLEILRRLPERHAIEDDRWRALERELAAMRDENRWLREAVAGHERRLADLLERLVATTEQVERLAGQTLAAANTGEQRRQADVDAAAHALGRIEERQLGTDPTDPWARHAFSVTSQGGEDGLLAFLLRHVPIAHPFFVEFGVEDYREANTRFLLQRRGWSGLVLDGAPERIAAVRASVLAFRQALTAICAFITRENIDTLLRDNGATGEIGILSIDIDGNDYWVWEAIESVQPTIVVIEYNFRFGPQADVAVPYAPDFVKEDADPSAIYYGASLGALTRLGARKGYDLVGCSDTGVNAFFVRRDRRPPIVPARSPADAFVPGRHAEWRDPEAGTNIHGIPLRRATFEEQQAHLLSLPLVRFDPETPS